MFTSKLTDHPQPVGSVHHHRSQDGKYILLFKPLFTTGTGLIPTYMHLRKRLHLSIEGRD